MRVNKSIVAAIALCSFLLPWSAQARFLQTDLIGGKDDLDLYAYVKDDPLNNTDPSGLCADGSDAPTGTHICPVSGKAQTTGTEGHAAAGEADANQMVKSGEYKSVHLDQKLSTITGDPAAGNQRPDVAGIRKDTGGVDTVEHPSKSQTPAQMDAKGKAMQEKLQAIGKAGTHETREISTVLKGMRGAGELGTIITAGSAAATVIQNPTKEGMNDALRDIVTGGLCGLMGGCTDAQAPGLPGQ